MGANLDLMLADSVGKINRVRGKRIKRESRLEIPGSDNYHPRPRRTVTVLWHDTRTTCTTRLQSHPPTGDNDMQTGSNLELYWAY